MAGLSDLQVALLMMKPLIFHSELRQLTLIIDLKMPVNLILCFHFQKENKWLYTKDIIIICIPKAIMCLELFQKLYIYHLLFAQEWPRLDHFFNLLTPRAFCQKCSFSDILEILRWNMGQMSSNLLTRALAI